MGGRVILFAYMSAMTFNRFMDQIYWLSTVIITYRYSNKKVHIFVRNNTFIYLPWMYGNHSHKFISEGSIKFSILLLGPWMRYLFSHSFYLTISLDLLICEKEPSLIHSILRLMFKIYQVGAWYTGLICTDMWSGWPSTSVYSAWPSLCFSTMEHR